MNKNNNILYSKLTFLNSSICKNFLKKSFLFPFKKITQLINNKKLYNKVKRLKNQKKIIYAITPPPRLRNIGDHAQAVAIKKWFKEEFPEMDVVEFDKDQVYGSLKIIKKITNKDDLIFLHSGGNLGDRGIWSERARRKIILNFPSNKIISLPQTIFFSDTDIGKKELETTKRIYNAHNNLTILARDPFSYKLAKRYFPNCKVLVAPDFVLYLDDICKKIPFYKREGVLLCLRNDNEGILKNEDKKKLKNIVKKIGYKYKTIDTTLSRDINLDKREEVLFTYLEMFKKQELVITDRFHGVIFSVITKTPCIAMKTTDHKLTESIKWFNSVNYVKYAKNFDEIPKLIKIILKDKEANPTIFKEKYFNDLKSKIIND